MEATFLKILLIPEKNHVLTLFPPFLTPVSAECHLGPGGQAWGTCPQSKCKEKYVPGIHSLHIGWQVLCAKRGSSKQCGCRVNSQISSKQEKEQWGLINGSHVQALAVPCFLNCRHSTVICWWWDHCHGNKKISVRAGKWDANSVYSFQAATGWNF